MSDLISRSALIEKIKERTEMHSKDYQAFKNYSGDRKIKDIAKWDECEVIIDIAKELPTVEAKPVVYGEWKRVGSGSLYDTYECTNCHRQPKWDCLGDNHWRIAFTDICPYCGAIMNGADMRGEKHD